MKLIVQEPFSWAHQHVNIKEYVADDEIETEDEDLIRVACEEGWVVIDGDEAAVGTGVGAPPKSKKKGMAPENKAVDLAPENK